MPMEIQCVNCHNRLMVETPGVVVACPYCGIHLQAPAAPPSMPAPAPVEIPAAMNPQGASPMVSNGGTDPNGAPAALPQGSNPFAGGQPQLAPTQPNWGAPASEPAATAAPSNPPPPPSAPAPEAGNWGTNTGGWSPAPAAAQQPPASPPPGSDTGMPSIPAAVPDFSNGFGTAPAVSHPEPAPSNPLAASAGQAPAGLNEPAMGANPFAPQVSPSPAAAPAPGNFPGMMGAENPAAAPAQTAAAPANPYAPPQAAPQPQLFPQQAPPNPPAHSGQFFPGSPVPGAGAPVNPAPAANPYPSPPGYPPNNPPGFPPQTNPQGGQPAAPAAQSYPGAPQGGSQPGFAAPGHYGQPPQPAAGFSQPNLPGQPVNQPPQVAPQPASQFPPNMPGFGQQPPQPGQQPLQSAPGQAFPGAQPPRQQPQQPQQFPGQPGGAPGPYGYAQPGQNPAAPQGAAPGSADPFGYGGTAATADAASRPGQKKGAAGGVSPTLFKVALGYASAVTLLTIYLLVQVFGGGGEKNKLENLPDLAPPRTKSNRTVSILKISPSTPVPPNHTLRLGESQTFGHVKVTPIRVERGPIKLAQGNSKPEESAPVLKLYLEFENVSSTDSVYPIDNDLVFNSETERTPPRTTWANTWVKKKSGGKPVLMYRASFKKIQDMELDRDLKPGEKFTTFIPCDDGDDYDNLKGELVWRVHIRKGHNAKSGRGVTTLIDVEFDLSEVKES